MRKLILATFITLLSFANAETFHMEQQYASVSKDSLPPSKQSDAIKCACGNDGLLNKSDFACYGDTLAYTSWDKEKPGIVFKDVNQSWFLSLNDLPKVRKGIFIIEAGKKFFKVDVDLDNTKFVMKEVPRPVDYSLVKARAGAMFKFSELKQLGTHLNVSMDEFSNKDLKPNTFKVDTLLACKNVAKANEKFNGSLDKVLAKISQQRERNIASKINNAINSISPEKNSFGGEGGGGVQTQAQ
ncbi:hypothetical protein [Halobacteriovorax sp. ZH2_bin.1]|uniref:hypothetical protein n=1 Tax=unclassified Halobacteriovorax TaxID=2639665 RepID=UPI00371425F5